MDERTRRDRVSRGRRFREIENGKRKKGEQGMRWVCERKEERERRLEEVSTSKMFAQDALAHGAERDCGRFRVLAGHLVVLFEVGSDGFGFDESKRRSQSRIEEATMGRKEEKGGRTMTLVRCT